jgi:phage head maturation protease
MTAATEEIVRCQRAVRLTDVYAVILPAAPDADSDDDRDAVFHTEAEAKAWLVEQERLDTIARNLPTTA